MPVHVSAGDAELSAHMERELSRLRPAGERRDLAVRLTDDDGELIGGLTGWTWNRTGCVAKIWAHDDRKGQGIDRRLVTAAEEEARSRGCTQMVASLFTFRLPAFYRSLGYVETERWVGFPDGGADLMFTKNLIADTPGSVRFAVILDIPPGVAGADYETSVLRLLDDHDGWLEQRLHTADGATEVQLITFGSRAGYESYLADPRRAMFRDKFLGGVGLPTRLIEVV